jgi:hypothetical protein
MLVNVKNLGFRFNILQRKSLGFWTFYTLCKRTEIASDVDNWTGHFWVADCTLGFMHRNSRLWWELGYNWFHSFKLFTVEVDCFSSGSPSCWHWFRGQVLFIGLHSMWGLKKHFFVVEINLFTQRNLTLMSLATHCSPWTGQVKSIKSG